MSMKQNQNDRCPICGRKIKQCPGHRRSMPKKAIVLLGTLLVLVAAVVLFLFAPGAPIENQKPADVLTAQKTPEGVQEPVFEKFTKDEVLQIYSPVRIYRNDEFHCNGLVKRTKKGYWAFALEDLDSGGNGHYSFQEYDNDSSKKQPVADILDYSLDNLTKLVIYIPGPKVEEEMERKLLTSSGIVAPWFPQSINAPFSLMSLSDHQYYQCIGRCSLGPDSELRADIIRCGSSAGEKGMAFVGKDGSIRFVLRRQPVDLHAGQVLGLEGVSEVSLALELTIAFDLPDYQLILQKLTDKKVSPVFSPVHIFRNGDFTGSGTLYDGPRGSRIVTAEHLFSKELPPAHFSYQKLQPYELEMRPISQIMDPKDEPLEYGAIADFGQVDVIICVPGPDRLIAGVSDLKIGPGEKSEHALTVYYEIPGHYHFTSLVTGETYAAIGSTSIRGADYLVLPCSTISGESGSGFINARGDILVLCKGLDAGADVSNVLPVPPGTEKLMAGFLLTQRGQN
jgi:hypothetical protein